MPWRHQQNLILINLESNNLNASFLSKKAFFIFEIIVVVVVVVVVLFIEARMRFRALTSTTTLKMRENWNLFKRCFEIVFLLEQQQQTSWLSKAEELQKYTTTTTTGTKTTTWNEKTSHNVSVVVVLSVDSFKKMSKVEKWNTSGLKNVVCDAYNIRY